MNLHVDILCQPSIPVDLLGVNLRRTLKGWWTPERERALDMCEERCVVCGYTKRLEVHETYLYDYPSHIAMYAGPVVLCAKCHRFVHLALTYASWLRRGAPSTGDLVDITRRGCEMLYEAGLLPSPGVVRAIRAVARNGRTIGEAGQWYVDNAPPSIPGVWHRPWRLYVPGDGLMDKEAAIAREHCIVDGTAIWKDTLATLAAKHKRRLGNG